MVLALIVVPVCPSNTQLCHDLTCRITCPPSYSICPIGKGTCPDGTCFNKSILECTHENTCNNSIYISTIFKENTLTLPSNECVSLYSYKHMNISTINYAENILRTVPFPLFILPAGIRDVSVDVLEVNHIRYISIYIPATVSSRMITPGFSVKISPYFRTPLIPRGYYLNMDRYMYYKNYKNPSSIHIISAVIQVNLYDLNYNNVTLPRSRLYITFIIKLLPFMEKSNEELCLGSLRDDASWECVSTVTLLPSPIKGTRYARGSIKKSGIFAVISHNIYIKKTYFYWFEKIEYIQYLLDGMDRELFQDTSMYTMSLNPLVKQDIYSFMGNNYIYKLGNNQNNQ
ncbi:hypothetical protein WA158_006441 [Blastocystis sp. Blastoise]